MGYRFSVLDRLGVFNFAQDQTWEFPGAVQSGLPDEIYQPVQSLDPITDVILGAYRGHEDGAIHVAASNGFRGTLTEQNGAAGKWSHAIANIGPSQFLVGWIRPGMGTVSTSVVDVAAGTITPRVVDAPIPPSSVFVTLFANGSMRFEGQAERSVTRSGETHDLLYSQEENGRIIGLRRDRDGVVMADLDGWFLVTSDFHGGLFPPFIDVHGNVAWFADPGGYATYADIRTRPISPTAPPAPGGSRPVSIMDGTGLVSPAPVSVADAVRQATGDSLLGQPVIGVIIVIGTIALAVAVAREG